MLQASSFGTPLSREIAAFIVYAGVSSVTVILRIPGLLIASSIIGLIFLLLIDNIYIYTDRKKTVILHSGQTFISALIIVSFISGIVLPFIFMALIKLVLFFYRLLVNKLNNPDITLRFLRIVFLVVPGMSLILHNSVCRFFGFRQAPVSQRVPRQAENRQTDNRQTIFPVLPARLAHARQAALQSKELVFP